MPSVPAPDHTELAHEAASAVLIWDARNGDPLAVVYLLVIVERARYYALIGKGERGVCKFGACEAIPPERDMSRYCNTPSSGPVTAAKVQEAIDAALQELPDVLNTRKVRAAFEAIGVQYTQHG
jgi:hypothetical protein